MQTAIDRKFEHWEGLAEAESILRTCVHCGFCNATCPTYQVTGDELDGPRGRIYQVKQVLEGREKGTVALQHLDRCLTCRSCESTCPSGVEYSRLADLGRELLEDQRNDSILTRLKKRALAILMPYPGRLRLLMRLAWPVKKILPKPANRFTGRNRKLVSDIPRNKNVLLLEGCVQQIANPETNHSLKMILNHSGYAVQVLKQDSCCGGLSHHMSEHDKALHFMKALLDQCEPYLDAGIDAILMSASGCGSVLKDYGKILQHEPEYRARAERLASLTKDASELLFDADLAEFQNRENRSIVFQSPCTLQHGQQVKGKVEAILERLGYDVQVPEKPWKCCGSAGVYSVLQPAISKQLQREKVDELQQTGAEAIITANIGCELHIGAKAGIPVIHWLDEIAANLTV